MRRTGSPFVLLDKRLVLPIFLVMLGIAGGIRLQGHLRLRHSRQRHSDRNDRVRLMNNQLVADNSELKKMMLGLQTTIPRSDGNGVSSSSQLGLSEAVSFSAAATLVYNQLHDRGELLSTKEELLWQKELELEETRKMVTERRILETEMAQFVNTLAMAALDINVTLPPGLARRPYVAQAVAQREKGGETQEAEFGFLLRASNRGHGHKPAESSEAEALLAATQLTVEEQKDGLALLSARPGEAGSGR